MKRVMFTKHIQDFSLPQIVKSLKHIGMDGADLCTRTGFPVNPENCETAMPEAAKRFADEGMGIELCTGPGDFTDPKAEYAERLFAACAEAGVGRIKLGYFKFAPGEDYMAKVAGAAKALDGFEALAGKFGVKAVYHTHCGLALGLNTAATMELVRGRDPQCVGVFLDTGHLSICGEPIPLAVAMAGEYLSCVALKELAFDKAPGTLSESPRARVMPFGYGNVDWPAACKALKAAKFGGPVSFHGEYHYAPEAVVGQCYVDKLLFEKAWEEAEG